MDSEYEIGRVRKLQAQHTHMQENTEGLHAPLEESHKAGARPGSKMNQGRLLCSLRLGRADLRVHQETAWR